MAREDRSAHRGNRPPAWLRGGTAGNTRRGNIQEKTEKTAGRLGGLRIVPPSDPEASRGGGQLPETPARDHRENHSGRRGFRRIRTFRFGCGRDGQGVRRRDDYVLQSLGAGG